jgi:membrane protease YdiL (CAAX protease family)
VKSESISALLLATLAGLLCIGGAIFMHHPGFGILIFNVSIMMAAFLTGFGIDQHPLVVRSRDLWTIRKSNRLVLILALVLALLLGLLARNAEGLHLIPSGMEWFVLVSMAIGATEELMFRGLIQGEAARWNPSGAVWLSALLFAAYKTAIFVWPDASQFNIPLNLFAFTFPAGLLLGYLRKRTGSILPGMIAHMLFDLILYADSPNAPWWVWD